LAQELSADVLLIDERLGARLARDEGLFVTGTLGVLKSASKRGLVSLEQALQELATTTFRHTPALFEELLRGDGEARPE
jgi:predicted nucleic acid-binding protein